jgi:hypothetical protein
MPLAFTRRTIVRITDQHVSAQLRTASHPRVDMFHMNSLILHKSLFRQMTRRALCSRGALFVALGQIT